MKIHTNLKKRRSTIQKRCRYEGTHAMMTIENALNKLFGLEEISICEEEPSESKDDEVIEREGENEST